MTKGLCLKAYQLIFREDWAETPAARPVTQEHVANPDLVISLHGPGQHEIKKSHHEELENDPYYIWSGKCSGNWALTLKHRRLLVDFSSGGVVRWRTRQSGTRQLHLIIKLENGPWLVSLDATGPSADWQEGEVDIGSTRWECLDIHSIMPKGALPNFLMNRVDAIGFSDLMHGGGSGECSRIDWIEVWGKPISRPDSGIERD